jgi:glycosyltransferase involved in cell wall biosynthesis
MKIIFFHNTLMPYRIPFFNKLTMNNDIVFIFTHIDIIKKIYNIDFDNLLKFLDAEHRNVLSNYCGFASGILTSVKKSKCDIIIGGSWDSIQEIIESMILILTNKYIFKKRFILYREDWDWPNNDIKRKIILKFAQWMIQNCDVIMVPGTPHKFFMIKMGKNPDQVIIVPNANISENDLQNKLFNSSQRNYVLFVGRLEKRKGVDILIKAYSVFCKIVKNVELIIIGDGSESINLNNIVFDLGLVNEIKFLGHLNEKLLKDFYTNCLFCVIPSTSYGMGDPWVFVLNEAMSYNKAVVASDVVGGAYDLIINGKNGYIVPERDESALATAMIDVVIKNICYDNNSMEIIKNGFTYEIMEQNFVRMIESLNMGE